jgi:hypothetical protein
MNIYCLWQGEVLLVKSVNKVIATVMMVGDEPCMVFVDGVLASLTFGEMEHIMDCWHNTPKS